MERNGTYVDDVADGIERAMARDGLTRLQDANGRRVACRVFNRGSVKRFDARTG